MIKTKHIFHDQVSETGEGNIFKIIGKSADSIMVIYCGDTDGNTPDALVQFYGRTSINKDFAPIQLFKASDYSLTYDVIPGESYYLDIVAYDEILAIVEEISGGKLTVIGEVIE